MEAVAAAAEQSHRKVFACRQISTVIREVCAASGCLWRRRIVCSLQVMLRRAEAGSENSSLWAWPQNLESLAWCSRSA